MRTKIIESTIDGLWLKVIVAVLEDEEISQPSALPYNVENLPGVPLLKLERKTKPEDVWILDLSTREGRAFTLDDNLEWEQKLVSANL